MAAVNSKEMKCIFHLGSFTGGDISEQTFACRQRVKEKSGVSDFSIVLLFPVWNKAKNPRLSPKLKSFEVYCNSAKQAKFKKTFN